MPTVTYHQDDPWEAGPLGAKAWFEGQNQAAVFNEGKRQFNEDLSLRHDQLSEQKREWTGDDDLKLKEIENLNSQGKLNRMQQEWLTQYQSRRQEALQNNAQTFEGSQRAADRKTSDLNSRRDAAVGIHGQNVQRYIADEDRKQREGSLSFEREQVNDQARTFDVAETVLQGRDPSTLSPEERESAIQAITDKLTGVERVRGDERDIHRASPEEIARNRQQAESVVNNYTQSKAQYTKTRLDEELQLANARSGRKPSAARYEGQMTFVETPDTDGSLGWDQDGLTAWVDVTGVQPINGSNLSPTDHGALAQAESMILDAHTLVGGDQRKAEAMFYSKKAEIEDLMKDLPPAYATYYVNALSNAINGTIQAPTIGEE